MKLDQLDQAEIDKSLPDTEKLLEDANLMYGRGLKFMLSLEQALKFPKEAFAPGVSSSKARNYIETLNNPELVERYDTALQTFRTRYKLADSCEITSEMKDLYPNFHEAVVAPFDPRRVNNLSKALWAAAPFFKSSFEQSPLEEYGRERIKDYEKNYRRFVRLRIYLGSKKTSRALVIPAAVRVAYELAHEISGSIYECLDDSVKATAGVEY